MPTLRTGDCGGFDHKDTILEADRIAFAIVGGDKVTANGGRERFTFFNRAPSKGLYWLEMPRDWGEKHGQRMG
jgi:hypothetical protein